MPVNAEKEITKLWRTLKNTQGEICKTYYRWREATIEIAGPDAKPLDVALKAVEIMGKDVGKSLLPRLNWLKGEEAFLLNLGRSLAGIWSGEGASTTVEKGEKEGLEGFLSQFRGERMTAVRANKIATDYFNKIKQGFPSARLIAGGLQEETNESLMDLAKAGMFALFLIFFILSLQFNSFTQPLIIMITIPFVTLGVMVGLLVSENPLTFITLIGLLALTGIVVNDSLVLIDFINRYRREHPKLLYLAIVRACHVRMRPIMVTSLTTIFAFAPMAFGLGGKSIFWAPLATAIMWGLGFATVLILSMVPCYYAILQDIGYLIRHRRRRKADTLREIEEAFQHEDLQPFLKAGKVR